VRTGWPEPFFFNRPRATSRRIVKLLHGYGVHYVFAGMPSGLNASGFRIAEVKGREIVQQHYPFGTGPIVSPEADAALK
jgi:hypothetical protein